MLNCGCDILMCIVIILVKMDGSSSESSTPMVSVLGKRKQIQPSGTLQLGTPLRLSA